MQLHRLKFNGPIDLAASCTPYTENRGDRQAFVAGTLYRAMRINGTAVVLKARAAASDEIEVEVFPASSGSLPQNNIVDAALRRKFSADLDLPAFYTFLENIPQLSEFARIYAGFRPFLKDSLLEALCLAIADQQVNVAFAAELKHRLLVNYGSRCELDGQTLWLFPPAEKLAQLGEHDLREFQYTRNKSSYIVGLARTFIEERIWERLTGTDEEIISRLLTLRGIGRWTAEYGAMMGIGLTNTLPAADIALMRVLKLVYALENRPSENEVREIGQQWSPWQGLVTFYLWHHEDYLLDGQPAR